MRKKDIQDYIIENNITSKDIGNFTLLWDVYFDSVDGELSLKDMQLESEFFKTLILLIEIDKHIFDKAIVDDILEEAEELLNETEGLEIEDSSLDYLIQKGFVEFNHEDDYLLRLKFKFETSFNKIIENFDKIVNTSRAELVI